MSVFSPAEAAACLTLVRLALAEDLGPTGDRTTLALIPPDQHAEAAFVARTDGVIAGLPAAALVCGQVGGGSLAFRPDIPDGSRVTPGQRVAVAAGLLRDILAAERT